MSENPILDKRILVTNDLSDETLVSCHSSAILQKTQLTCLAIAAAAVHELVGAPDFLTNPPCNIGKTLKNVIV